ncbi:MAG: DUF952 domain-containing protein [Armatimonadota bacterium]
MIYHFALESDWRRAQESRRYEADSLMAEGFLHCATADQLETIAHCYFHGVPGLLLLSINEQKLTSDLKWDENELGETYPHLHGHLNLDAVEDVVPLECGSDGAINILNFECGQCE